MEKIDFENFNYYLTENNEVVTVDCNGYSFLSEDDCDCFTGSPFKYKSASDLGWTEISDEVQFPEWFLNSINDF